MTTSPIGLGNGSLQRWCCWLMAKPSVSLFAHKAPSSGTLRWPILLCEAVRVLHCWLGLKSSNGLYGSAKGQGLLLALGTGYPTSYVMPGIKLGRVRSLTLLSVSAGPHSEAEAVSLWQAEASLYLCLCYSWPRTKAGTWSEQMK